jgi:hypothetical protein
VIRYPVGQRHRKRIEKGGGWLKTVGAGRRTRCLGLERTRLHAQRAVSAYDLIRNVRLAPVTT